MLTGGSAVRTSAVTCVCVCVTYSLSLKSEEHGVPTLHAIENVSVTQSWSSIFAIPHLQIQLTVDHVLLWRIFGEKNQSMCKGTHTIQTLVVQGATVFVMFS